MSKDKHKKTWEEEASPEDTALDAGFSEDESLRHNNADTEETASVQEEEGRLEEPEKKDEEIGALKEEIAALKESMLRRQADFENYKKRMIKDREETRRNAIKDMALDIIGVNDDLLRAIDAAGSLVIEDSAAKEAYGSFVQGVEMTSKSIESVLKKYGVEEIEAENMEFNPVLHEAVEIAQSPDVERDTVTFVYQKGFKMNDLVVRSARVRVTKPESRSFDDEGDSAEESGE